MFGIGMTEIIVILIIALLVIGPEKLQELAKTLGKGLAEFKRTAEDFRNTIHEDMRAEEEKQKLLKKAQKNKESQPGKETADEKKQGEALKAENEEYIADQAPPSESDLKSKHTKHEPS